MGPFQSFQSLVLYALGALALGAQIFAFIDAVRAPDRAYVAAGKRTKTFWLVVLGICLAAGIVIFPNVLNLIGIASVVGAGVYLADVRPALRHVLGKGGRGPNW